MSAGPCSSGDRGRIASMADSTFGRGQNAAEGIVAILSMSANVWAMTEMGP